MLGLFSCQERFQCVHSPRITNNYKRFYRAMLSRARLCLYVHMSVCLSVRLWRSWYVIKIARRENKRQKLESYYPYYQLQNVGGLRKTTLSAKVRFGHSRSLLLVPIESAYATSH